MKNFLSTVKGKVIAGAITFAVIAAAVVVIVLLNTGYRTISVDDLTGVTKITAGKSVSEAFKRQNLKSGYDVFVEEASDLTLALDTDKHVYAGEFTSFSLEAAGKPGKDSRTVIRLDEGSVLSEIDEKLSADESYVVESPNATMAVRGTIFTVTVSYDEEGLCHTLVEVEKGTVEVTKKDENGNPTDEIETLEAGNKIEITSLPVEDDNRSEISTTSSTENGTTSHNEPNTPTPETFELKYYDELIFNNPDAIEVEKAIEAFLNGNPLVCDKLDRITHLEIFGQYAFVGLDNQYGGKGFVNGYSDYSADDFNGGTYAILSYTTGIDVPETELDITKNQLKDLSFTSEMKNLGRLSVNYGDIQDISAVRDLTKLSDLNIFCNALSDISPLEGLTNITHLSLDHNKKYDPSPIYSLTNLEDLSLDNFQAFDYSKLLNFPNLTGLSIFGSADGYSNIDLSAISQLSQLSFLQILECGINDISFVSNMTNLKTLNLSTGDEFRDITPLSKLTKLERLALNVYQVNDFSPLYGLSNLKEFRCNGMDDDELAKLQQALPETTIINR